MFKKLTNKLKKVIPFGVDDTPRIKNPCEKDPTKECPYEVKVRGYSLYVEPSAVVNCCKCIDQRRRMNEFIATCEADKDYNGIIFTQNVIDGARRSLGLPLEKDEDIDHDGL